MPPTGLRWLWPHPPLSFPCPVGVTFLRPQLPIHRALYGQLCPPLRRPSLPRLISINSLFSPSSPIPHVPSSGLQCPGKSTVPRVQTLCGLQPGQDLTGCQDCASKATSGPRPTSVLDRSIGDNDLHFGDRKIKAQTKEAACGGAGAQAQSPDSQACAASHLSSAATLSASLFLCLSLCLSLSLLAQK